MGAPPTNFSNLKNTHNLIKKKIQKKIRTPRKNLGGFFFKKLQK